MEQCRKRNELLAGACQTDGLAESCAGGLTGGDAGSDADVLTGSAAPADIRAAFFDIDGTLTSFATHTVPDSTIRALKGLQKAGVKIFICTGRTPEHMRVVLDSMPVHFDGIVGANGQFCMDDSGVLKAEAISTADIGTILDWLDAHAEITANFGERDYTYFNQVTPEMLASWHALGKTAPRVNIDEPRARYLFHPIYQVSPYVTPEQEKEIIDSCAQVRGVRWHPDFVDLIPADGGKNRGMEVFLKKYGWGPEHAIAFGDGGNDVDMLRYAGIGVAMGNATMPAIEASDYVTSSVDDDGIERALQHFGVL